MNLPQIIAKDQSEEMPLTSTVTCTIFIDDINGKFKQLVPPSNPCLFQIIIRNLVNESTKVSFMRMPKKGPVLHEYLLPTKIQAHLGKFDSLA